MAMKFLDFKIRQMKLQYKVLVAMLVICVLSGRYWHLIEDPIVEEAYENALVLSTRTPDDGSSGVGSNSTFATVELDSGEKARIPLSGQVPETGIQIKVKTTKFASGKIRVSQSEAF